MPKMPLHIHKPHSCTTPIADTHVFHLPSDDDISTYRDVGVYVSACLTAHANSVCEIVVSEPTNRPLDPKAAAKPHLFFFTQRQRNCKS